MHHKCVGILVDVIYIATIGEAADKPSEIRAIAAIKYSNAEISERPLTHIIDLSPTDALPAIYYE